MRPNALPHRLDSLTQIGAAVSILLAVSLPFSAAQAQEPAGDESESQKRSGVWIEPRVSGGLTFTDNSRLESTNPQSDQILSISPGVRAVFNNARIIGSVDYSLTGLYYANGSFENGIQHTLDGLATINVWGNRAFLDVSGLVDRQTVSVFDAQSVGDFNNPNLTETARFRLSPYFRGYLGGSAEYEARYSLQTTRTDVANRSDYTAHDWLLAFRNRDVTQRLGWTLEARAQDNEYTLDRKTQSRSLEGGLTYNFTPVLRGTIFAGGESNDVVSLDRKSYSSSGASVDWQPSDRTRVVIGFDKRYYGNGHNVLLEHRTGRTVWRYVDTKGAVNNSLEDAVPLLGANYDLLESFYIGLEPDPVKRAELVEAELLRLGLPSTYELYRRFITSSATFERNQQFSFVLEGARSVTTVTLGRNNSRRLDSGTNPLGDDFDNVSTIFQDSWAIVYAHRLTPLTSASLALSGLKNRATNIAVGNSSRSLAIGMTTRFGLRTSGSVQLQRTVFEGTVSPYDETSVVGVITHRF